MFVEYSEVSNQLDEMSRFKIFTINVKLVIVIK